MCTKETAEAAIHTLINRPQLPATLTTPGYEKVLHTEQILSVGTGKKAKEKPSPNDYYEKTEIVDGNSLTSECPVQVMMVEVYKECTGLDYFQ